MQFSLIQEIHFFQQMFIIFYLTHSLTLRGITASEMSNIYHSFQENLEPLVGNRIIAMDQLKHFG